MVKAGLAFDSENNQLCGICFENISQKLGFENRGLWADPEKGILEYQKKRVLEATVVDDQLKITIDSKWEQHFSHAEWNDTVKNIRDKLARRGEKGAGKAAPE